MQVPDESLETYLKPVWAGEKELMSVYRTPPEGQPEKIAEGYELTQTLTATVEDKPITWAERWLAVRSLRHARASEAALQARLTKAQAALEALKPTQVGQAGA